MTEDASEAGAAIAQGPKARLFVAVELPAELQLRLEARARRLREVEAGVRAVRSDAIHLTVQFLGAVERTRLAELHRALADVAAHGSPFEAELVGLGAFPRVDAAQVVWAGVRPAESVARLAARVADALARLGFARDPRLFHPHVTIGRLKGRGRRRALGDALRSAGEESLGGFGVTAMTLFESFLARDGARYVALARCALGGPAGAPLA